MKSNDPKIAGISGMVCPMSSVVNVCIVAKLGDLKCKRYGFVWSSSINICIPNSPRGVSVEEYILELGGNFISCLKQLYELISPGSMFCKHCFIIFMLCSISSTLTIFLA